LFSWILIWTSKEQVEDGSLLVLHIRQALWSPCCA
jgi:hypothetical protein